MSWLGRLFRRNALERSLDRELRFHLDAAIADHVRAGLSRAEAERRARIELGGVEQVKEEARDARGTRWIEDWWSDTRYALRGMVRSPAFSAAAILTLAVGIGANTAVWSIVDALMLRSLPIDRPEELHAVRRAGNEDNSYLVSYEGFRHLQGVLADSSQLAAMGGIDRMYAVLGDAPVPVPVQLVSGEWFGLLGVRAELGRLIARADNITVGGHPVVVLASSFWHARMGGDPAVVGKTIRVNGLTLTIIGVAEEGFVSLTVGQPVAMWVPLMEQHEIKYASDASSSNSDTDKPWIPQPGISWLTQVARTPLSAVRDVTARLDRRFQVDLKEHVATFDSSSRVYALREHLVLDPLNRGFSPLRQFYQDPLKILFASVGLVLLIACGNLAGLQMARGAARAYEMSVRVSMGAQPGRLVRQVLTESVTLAVVGGVFSVAVARWGSAALLKAASSGPRAIPLDAGLSTRVLVFALGAALVTGVLFGMAPAFRILRSDLYETFRSGGRVFGRGGHRLPMGRVLVASQIALSLVLVTSAGLFVRTFQNYLSIDPGFETERVVTARLDIRQAGYTHDQLPGLYDRLLEAARTVPGVRSASMSLNGVAGNSRRYSSFEVPGRTLVPPNNGAQENFVSPDYFTTSGITLLSGRTFTTADKQGAPRVAIVSEVLAKSFFGTANPVGMRFGYGTPQFEVVGVVRDLRVNGLREAPRRLVYYPLAQGTHEYVSSIEARVVGPATPAIDAVRSAIARVDKNLPVREVTTVADLLERGLTRERLVARLAGTFGLLALLLAGIGLYGVIGYSVARRTNEMGVRLALGSSPAGVSWLVIRDSLSTIALGLGFGILLSYPLLSLTRRLLFGLSPYDPVTLAGAAALLVVVGAIAALMPALRAARIDPLEAIRAE